MAKKSNIPSPEIRRWLSRCESAEKKRDDADSRFGYSRALKMYGGDFESTLPSFLLNTAVVPINEPYGFVKSFIPSVYSRNPHICFNPASKSHIASSKILELMTNAYWRELRLKRQVRRCIFDAIFAEGWMKTGFSSSFGSIDKTNKRKREDGEEPVPLESNEFVRDREIFSTRVSWRHMVRDEEAVDGIHDARFVAQKIIKPLDAVLDSALYTAKDITATHSYTPGQGTLGSRRRPDEEREEFIELWEIWDQDTAKVYWVSQGCADFLRDPEPWPYRFNGYPFDLLRFNQLEDESYAPNCIGPWEAQLFEKIKIRSMQMDHIKRFNRQLWAEKGTVSKAELEKFSRGQTGAINFYEGKTPPIPAQYPQIQTDIYAIENRIDLDKDNISGQPNAVRSAPQKTQSRTLGEINTMVAAFQARQVDPQGDVEDFCAEISLKIAAVAQDYLKGDKLLRVTQEDAPAIKEAFGERFDGMSIKASRDDIRGAEFEASVTAGSTLPLDRQNRVESMVNILKLGAAIGLTPGDMTSKVIGKNLMGEFELKEVELAYTKMISEMENAKKLAMAQARLQQGALEQKLANARQMVNGQGGAPQA